MTSITLMIFQTLKMFTTLITLNANYKIFLNGEVIFLVKYQKTLTKNKRKSNILRVEVHGDACINPHNKKGEARQDEQF